MADTQKENLTNKYWKKRARQDKLKVIRTQEKGIDSLKRLLKTNLDDVEKKITAFYDKYADNFTDTLTYTQAVKYKMKLKQNAYKFKKDKILQKILREDAPKYKIERLRALQTDLQIQLAVATAGQQKGIYKTLEDVAKVSQASVKERFKDVSNVKFNTIADKKLQKIIGSDWSGKNWSERLWKDREKVGMKVQELLETGLPQGRPLQDMARDLKDATQSSFNDAFRLIRTEAAHVDGQVKLEGYKQSAKDLGYTEYVYDAFLDDRTSKICQELNGQKFPIDEAEVGVNYPPMHPNCRSTTHLDEGTMDDDFDFLPDDWEEKKEPEEVLNKNNIAEKIENNSIKNIDIEEIMQEALEEQKQIQNDYIEFDKKRIEYNRKWLLEGNAEAQKQADFWYKKAQEKYIEKQEYQNRVAQKIINQLNNIPNNLEVKTVRGLESIALETQNNLNKLINKNIISDKTIPMMRTFEERSRFIPAKNIIEIDDIALNRKEIGTTLHESMHWLEHNNKNILNKSVAFLEYRTEGEVAKKLSEITGFNYKDTEIAKKDRFFSPYVGKIYKHTNGEYWGTEILSMGVEELYNHPLDLYKKDKEYFNFIIAVLRKQL